MLKAKRTTLPLLQQGEVELLLVTTLAMKNHPGITVTKKFIVSVVQSVLAK